MKKFSSLGLVLCLGLMLCFGAATAAVANLCDPDDAAAVAAIQNQVDSQLLALGDFQQMTDALLELAEHELGEVEGQSAYADALLEVDLARLLNDSCAGVCPAPANLHGQTPQLPRRAASATSGRCWSCAHPRLMITAANGGLLDAVVDMVRRDTNRAIERGLPVDTAQATDLALQAEDAVAAGAAEMAFGLTCQAYSVLSCDAGAHAPTSPTTPLDSAAAAAALPTRRSQNTAHADPSRSPRNNRTVDSRLTLLQLSVGAVSSQIAGTQTLVQLFLDQFEAIEALGHEVEEKFADGRRRQLEDLLLACGNGAARCLDPNILISALNDDCQDYSIVPHHRPQTVDAALKGQTRDHVPAFECLLRDIIIVVAEDLHGAQSEGLDRDYVTIQEQLDEAIHHGEFGHGREAFAHACNAFAKLTCP